MNQFRTSLCAALISAWLAGCGVPPSMGWTITRMPLPRVTKASVRPSGLIAGLML